MMDDATKDRLLALLSKSIGPGRIFSRPSDLIPYSRDTFAIRFSEEDKHLPDLAVLPISTQEVVACVKAANEFSLPIIPKGGGTSRTGMLVPVSGGMVVDTISLNKLLKIEALDRIVRVQAGINLQELEMLLRGQKLTLGHEQGSQKIATVGGAIATASYSRKNQKYGNLWERLSNLEIVLGDGTLLATGTDVPYTSSGVDLASLFVGSEGTLGIITEVSIRVFDAPEQTLPLLILFPDYPAAESAADRIMARGVSFVGGTVWEDSRGFKDIGSPSFKAALTIAFEGTKDETEAARSLVSRMGSDLGGKMAEEKTAREYWDEFLMHWCGMRAEVGHEDVIVAYIPRTRKDEYFHRLLDEILPRHGLSALPGERMSFDFGRHMIFATRFSIPRTEDGWTQYIAAVDETAKLIASLRGTVAACHGVGLLHKDHIRAELGPAYIDLMQKVKCLMDPKGIMNPGKKFS